MTRFVEVRQRGLITRRVDGTFNNLYSKFDYFDAKPVSDAKVDVLRYDEMSGELVTFNPVIFPMSNPYFADAKGAFVLSLNPGNYLIKISKPGFGSKDILFNSESHSLYSQDVYLTYNYDLFVWSGIFMAVFIFVWYVLSFSEFLKLMVLRSIEKSATKKAF